jgi:predicted AlkP superfamily pyrophosphatase or phosphodiesterase
MRRVLVLLLAFTCSPLGFAQSTQGPPRLVLVISIDQMRFDYLTRFDALYKGGFRTLLDRGAVFTNASYRHAATETGPGHSVLLSGRHPSHSGIVANEWYDAYLDRAVNVVDDPVQTTVGGRGRAASPVNSVGFTVGDVLKARNPLTKVVGVSLKDRSAILMGGLRADAAYWFENDGGNFITSTFYMEAAPEWLTAWNAQRAPDRFAGQPWTRLLPDVSVYDKYAGPDAVEGERDGKDITFPHVFTSKPPQTGYYEEFRRTAFSDGVLTDFAIEALKQHRLGADAVTDVFAVGFSGTDHVGHAYGPDSHEMMDQILRLDLNFGRLLQEIDAAVELDNTLVVLSADHGIRPLVEVSRSRGVAARRVAPSVLLKAVTDAFARKYRGVSDLISYFATDIYLDEEVIRRHHLKRHEVERTAVEALMGTGLVERVYTHDDLRNASNTSDPFLPLYRNMFFEPRTPHLSVRLKRDVYVASGTGGTGHGSVYEFDRHVPVAFMGSAVKPGRYAEQSGPEDIAPTIAHMLGLQFPSESDARVLTEMIR